MTIWYSAFLSIFLLAVLFIILIIQRKKHTGGSMFIKKDRVMTESEQALYINLQKTLGDKYIILSHVRIEDFIVVDDNKVPRKRKESMRNQIKSRHVDFLICDFESTKTLLAIELDGGSHSNGDQVERDNFVNELYKGVGLPIEHIAVGTNFEREVTRLKKILLSENIK